MPALAPAATPTASIPAPTHPYPPPPPRVCVPRGFDWDALAQRRLRAPYVPKVAGPADASNFDGGQAAGRGEDSRYISTGVFRDF